MSEYELDLKDVAGRQVSSFRFTSANDSSAAAAAQLFRGGSAAELRRGGERIGAWAIQGSPPVQEDNPQSGARSNSIGRAAAAE